MREIICHHYPQSPVAEKVRVALGIKQLSWRSVTIPRVPPKPDVDLLTGGYRRTPIMQIGADVYCDSLCILQALEATVPEPSLFPDGNPCWWAGRWTDTVLIDLAAAIVLGAGVENLPPEFAADRGRLYFGPNYDLHVFNRDLPHLAGQLRGHFGMMQESLGAQRFMHGERPGLRDVLCYYIVWFIRGRFAGGPELLTEFGELCAWEGRVADLGHGQSCDMSPEESLDSALGAASAAESRVDPEDPAGLEADEPVEVVPDGEGGDPPVRGDLVILTRDHIAVRRAHERVGEVVVHFPRIGYRVARPASNQ
ncbi:glutathione S-transferase family protein [Pseudomonadota bacterium]